MKLTNEEKAQRELDCFMYCMYQALYEFKKKNYKYSAVYLENAARSLRELEELKVVGNQSNHIVNVFVIGRHNDGNY